VKSYYWDLSMSLFFFSCVPCNFFSGWM
jgi:hypothetical protein